MRDQIFLSHAVEDKDIVAPIAEELRLYFGEDKVFYDSWSMVPGDSLIHGMNKGLEDCAYFFLFMSQKSLTKPMVSLEWHNALVFSLRGQARFIPVRMEDISPPAILMATLYLDMFNQGLSKTIKDIKLIASGKSVYDPESIKPFENLLVDYRRNGEKVDFGIGAKRLAIHDNTFAFWTEENYIPQVRGISHAGVKQLTINGVNKRLHWVKPSNPITPTNPSIISLKDIKKDTMVEIYHLEGTSTSMIFSGQV